MRLFIENDGDRSVGSSPTSIKIDDGMPTSEDALGMYGGREQVRQRFKQFWTDFLGEQVSVRFDDECGDCGHVLIQEKCINVNCVRNVYLWAPSGERS